MFVILFCLFSLNAKYIVLDITYGERSGILGLYRVIQLVSMLICQYFQYLHLEFVVQ